MSSIKSPVLKNTFSPVFSGHETFSLRSTWLKKAYDLLQSDPELFLREDAFIQLGVGKNMAQSIRYWGKICGMFDRLPGASSFELSKLATDIFDSERGWDPFLVTPASRWLLHWQISSRPEAAYTWYFTFNQRRSGEFTLEQLASEIVDNVRKHGWSVPSSATLQRDIACMLHCYIRPNAKELLTSIEDALTCPLHDIGLVHSLPGDRRYFLASGSQPDLPDTLIAYAIAVKMRKERRSSIPFNELAYAPSSPGMVFRLNEDSLIERLWRLESLTAGQAYFTDQGGIRQVAWSELEDVERIYDLLRRAFLDEIAV